MFWRFLFFEVCKTDTWLHVFFNLPRCSIPQLRALDPVYMTSPRSGFLYPRNSIFFQSRGGYLLSMSVCPSVRPSVRLSRNFVYRVSTPWKCSIGLGFFLFDRTRLVVVSPKRWGPLAKWFGFGAHWRDAHLAAPCISYGREMSLCCVQYFWFLDILIWVEFFCIW